MNYRPKTGFWLTDSSAPAAEIVAKLGFDFVVLDVEHGMFDLRNLEYFIPLLKGLGLDVWAKVLGPAQEPIQQALDFGADGVIIPHIRDVEHAAKITAHAKYPPLGDRSLSGGRTFGYNAWSYDQVQDFNRTVQCFPLIEHPDGVRDIEQIAALPTVDGFQIGTSDLALMSGRGYSQSEADWADINKCVNAFKAAGKSWLFPAWTEREQRWALDNEAPLMLIAVQYHFLRAALSQAKEAFDVLAIGASERPRAVSL
ncbi:aldolase/citrate lyase family protein [Ensifer sp. ENS12]|uniref:HpcH/HpaI aldolase family protein n=1 Tax=Ensifer sp. ENS12 TaxID=2854774 RepID=UPI001C4457AF|nr:aldolase/citrate lyase family protein [Ensifer sp. ENS12]MBV7518972.1 4-hydroxy-2-oxovalerate aldolase [Ensifer sp. ENS12]